MISVNRLNSSPNNCNEKVIVAFIDSSWSNETKEGLEEGLWCNINEQPNQIDDDQNGFTDDIYGWDFIDKGQIKFMSLNDLSHGDLVIKNYIDSVQKHTGNESRYEIMLLRVMNEDGVCKNSDIISAIRYAEENGAQICNLSISTYHDDDELRATLEASEMLFVVAAGNESENLDGDFPSYPTKYKLKNVISVAALDETGRLLETSNYGKNSVDVGALGVIEDESIIAEGTSFSAPKVTAMATILYSCNPNCDAIEIKKELLLNVKKKRVLKNKLITEGLLDEDDI